MRRTGVFYDHVFDGRSPEPSVNRDCAKLPTDPDLSLPFPTAPLENVRKARSGQRLVVGSLE